MTKPLFAILIGVLLAAVQAPPPVSGVGPGQACSTTAWVNGGPYCVTACPQGDGEDFADAGAQITVVVKDNTGTPVPGIPASDFWLIGCNDALVLCGGAGSIDADSASNASGVTTISGDVAAGGCDSGVQVVVQGIVIRDPADCVGLLCLPINVISVDYNADLVVNLVDFSIFGPAFPSPPQTYDTCLDYNCDGVINLVDFSIFGGHFLHQC